MHHTKTSIGLKYTKYVVALDFFFLSFHVASVLVIKILKYLVIRLILFLLLIIIITMAITMKMSSLLHMHKHILNK